MINVLSFAGVVAYLRYSDHKQDDGFSIEYQTSEVNEYAKSLGIEITRYFVDRAQTATKVSGRENFFALINAVKKGEVKTIIVYKLSRMFRNTYESSKYRDLFRKHGVKLISVTETVDEETAAGRFTTNIMSSVDQYQSETTSDHVKSSMREMARQCYYTGGHIRFGYDVKPSENDKKRKIFVKHPVEAPVVKMIFEMSAAGQSNNMIRNFLNDNGYKTKYGKPFSNSFVNRVIQDKMYTGIYRFRTSGYDDVIVPNGIPAIVSNELYEKANAEKQARRTNIYPIPRKTERLYALTGKITCAECGQPYTGFSSIKRRNGIRKDYIYYVCKGKKVYKNCNSKFIDKGFLEDEALKAIRAAILNEDKIKELAPVIVEMCQQSPSDIDAQIKENQSQKASIEKKLNKIAEAFFDDDTESEFMKAQILKLEKQLSQVKLLIYSLKEKQKSIITTEAVEKYMRDMLAKSSSNNDDELKIIFDNFVNEIIVTADKIEIKLNAFADGLQDRILQHGTEIPVLRTLTR